MKAVCYCHVKIFKYISVVIISSIVVFCVSASNALAPVPDIGIDYQMMQVNDKEKLVGNGMKDVKKGDKVDVQISQGGKMTIINTRTGEVLIINIE